MSKQYKLTDVRNIYLSDTPGEYGGNSKLKVYGRLDCGTAYRKLAQTGIKRLSQSLTINYTQGG